MQQRVRQSSVVMIDMRIVVRDADVTGMRCGYPLVMHHGTMQFTHRRGQWLQHQPERDQSQQRERGQGPVAMAAGGEHGAAP